MESIIRTYQARTGIVTITYYGDVREYLVSHSNKALQAHHWYKDKTEAIRHAQFLAGKY